MHKKLKMAEKDSGKIKLHATQEAQLLSANWHNVESIHFWNMKGNKLHRYSLRNTFEIFKLHSRKVCYKNKRWYHYHESWTEEQKHMYRGLIASVKK